MVAFHCPGNTAEVRAGKDAPPYFNQHNRTDVSLIFRIPVPPVGILQLRYGHHHPIYLPCVGYTSGPDFHDRSVSLVTPCEVTWCSCGLLDQDIGFGGRKSQSARHVRFSSRHPVYSGDSVYSSDQKSS